MLKVKEDDNMKKININEVEQLTGVSKRNIRFYEKEGLIVPERNEVNGYREYREADVRRIKLIRMFRMLDMPLEKISSVLDNECSLETAVSEQKKHLEQQAQELQLAIQFCDRLKNQELQMLDVDSCLYEMGKSGTRGFFQAWVDDYKKIKDLNHKAIGITGNVNSDFKDYADVLIDYGVGEESVGYVTKGVVTLTLFFMLFAVEASLNTGYISREKYNELKEELEKCPCRNDRMKDIAVDFYNKHMKEMTSMSVAYFCGFKQV